MRSLFKHVYAILVALDHNMHASPKTIRRQSKEEACLPREPRESAQ